MIQKKIFLAYVISLFALWIGYHSSDQYATTLSRQIYSLHLVDKVFPLLSILFVKDVGTYLFGIQFLALLFILLINGRSGLDKGEKSVLIEIIMLTLFSLNIAIVIFIILGVNFIFNPNKSAFLLILFFITVAIPVIAYNIKKESDGTSDSSDTVLRKSIEQHLRTFNFPYSRIVLFLSFLLMLGCGIFDHNTNSFLTSPVIKPLLFLFVILGIIYSLFGLVSKAQRLDELQRQILYEQFFIVTVVLEGLLFGSFALGIFFQLKLEITDVIMIIGPAALISGVFIRDKYR